MDYLSFSPSLISVLSLLKRRDISQCRMVNRRFYETISSHHRLTPRKKITVCIDGVRGQTDQEWAIKITGRTIRSDYYLYYYRHLEDFDFSICIDNQSILVPSGSDHVLFKYVYEESIVGLSIEDLFGGLRIVLTPLFRRCNVLILTMTDSSTESNIQWQHTVANIFKMNNDDCDFFRCPFWTTLNSIFIESGNLELIRPGAHKWAIFSQLPETLSRHQVDCHVPSISNTIEMMADLFKSWYEGHCRLMRFRLFHIDINKRTARWLPGLIINIFGTGCQWHSFAYRKRREDGSVLYSLRFTYIRRPRDDMVLCLSQCRPDNYFSIYDVMHSGSLDEIHYCVDQFI